MFDEQRLETFIQTYNQNSPVPVNVGKLNQYLIFTCLRGLTWCSMAYVQYHQEDKVLTNDDTFKVIKRYMTADFLTMIENYVDQRMKSFM